MRGFFSLANATWVASVLATVAAGATIAQPGGIDDIIITADNILNSTTHYDLNSDSSSNSPLEVNAVQTASAALPLSMVNNFNAGMNMYITGMDGSGTPCFIGSSGGYVYPNANGASTPKPITAAIKIALGAKGSTTKFTIPGTLQSARIWFAKGELKFYTVADANGVSSIVMPSAANPQDPSAGIQWGFIEFNYDGNSIFANISYVDFVGLPLGMSITVSDGSQQIVKGLKAQSVESICQGLIEQTAADGKIWDKLCTQNNNGNALRVLSPNLYVSANPSAFQTYYADYVNKVWTKYTSQALKIDTQSSAGTVACQVSGSSMTCAGDNRAYPKPTTTDIWGCNSGPFAIQSSDNAIHSAVVPRLCAAFERSTLLLSGGNVQPSLPAADYYTVNPTNHYSRIVHEYEVNNIGYAFSYDDVNPKGQNAAGTVSGNNPTLLKVTIGSWS
ncbi:glycoside hydrolase family 64 protein [Xylariaceae sp. FL0255]|nr:glycoside hydrolase family 64 protein [Xylariaceae sp. FL0255]